MPDQEVSEGNSLELFILEGEVGEGQEVVLPSGAYVYCRIESEIPGVSRKGKKFPPSWHNIGLMRLPCEITCIPCPTESIKETRGKRYYVLYLIPAGNIQSCVGKLIVDPEFRSALDRNTIRSCDIYEIEFAVLID